MSSLHPGGLLRKHPIFRFCLLALLTSCGGFAGCASDPASQGPSASQSTGVSAIPWNRPESWEGGVGIPGFGQINEHR